MQINKDSVENYLVKNVRSERFKAGRIEIMHSKWKDFLKCNNSMLSAKGY